MSGIIKKGQFYLLKNTLGILIVLLSLFCFYLSFLLLDVLYNFYLIDFYIYSMGIIIIFKKINWLYKLFSNNNDIIMF